MRALGLGCAGALLLAGGVLLAPVSLLAAAEGAEAGVVAAAVLGSMALLSLAFGGLLVHSGLRASAGAAPATGLRPGRRGAGPMAWALVFAGALALGGLAIGLGGSALVLMPVLHLAAALAPAMAIVGYAAWSLGGHPGRRSLAALAWGGLGATAIAFLLELFFGLVLALVLWAALASSAEGSALLERIWAQLSAAPIGPGGLDPGLLAELQRELLRPSVLLAVFAMLGLIGPTVEELAKAAGVALLRPATRGEAFLLGVACGAGFGLAEAILIGATSVVVLGWLVMMLVRAASTIMHAAVGGWVGLGVGALQRELSWSRGLGFLALAILVHGLWNLLVLSAVLGALAAASGFALGGPVAAVSPVLLVLLFGAVLFGLRGQARRLAGASTGPGAAAAR